MDVAGRKVERRLCKAGEAGEERAVPMRTVDRDLYRRTSEPNALAVCNGGLKAPGLSDFSLKPMLPLPSNASEGRLLQLSQAQFNCTSGANTCHMVCFTGPVKAEAM